MYVATLAVVLALQPAAPPATRPAVRQKQADKEAEEVRRQRQQAREAADKKAEEARRQAMQLRLQAIQAAQAQQAAQAVMAIKRPIGIRPIPGPGVQPTTPVLSDEEALKAANVPNTAPGLLDFVRRRTAAPDKDKLEELLKGLGDKSAPTREGAAAELVGLGPTAVPALRRAANNLDEPDRAARARACLQSIEGPGGANLARSAVRQLAAHGPDGSAEALIRYLPFADDDEVVREVEAALIAVARRDAQAGPALVKALKDPVPVRRYVAAQALCKTGRTSAVRPLLKDPKPTVRLRAALGLTGAHDAEAVPVLVDLLGELPPAQSKQAEEYLNHLAGEWAVAGPAGNDPTSRRIRKGVWAAWWKNTDGEQLLKELRSRTPSDKEHDAVLALIKQLDDESADVRARAAAALVEKGREAAPLLRQAGGQGRSQRVEEAVARCLEAIEKDGADRLANAAPRLLALRRPEGTVEALLGYLPYAENEDMAAEIIDILGSIGCPEGKADPALVKGLEDRLPTRRAGAALALCKGGAEDALPAVRKLFKDGDATVRMKTALALARRSDKGAVPVLIDLLGELPLEQAGEVEDYLSSVAGDKTPAVGLGTDRDARAKCKEAWAAWWKENRDKADLTRVETPGLVVVENWNPQRGNGRVLVLNAAGKVQREVANLMGPWDAQLLRNGHILISEWNNSRVTERDRQGKVVWEKLQPGVFHVERLRNGNTLICTRNNITEVNRKGEAVFTHQQNFNAILAARKLRDGQYAYLTYQGQYIRLDSAGKQVKTSQFPVGNFGLGGADILPGDRVVVSVQGLHKVIEYSADGKPVWEAQVMLPNIPHRARNGHTYVVSNNTAHIYELDSKGKIVKEMKDLPYRPFAVRER